MARPMSQGRFVDRFRYFKGEPQQVSGASMLFDAIAQGWSAERILDEDAPWAVKYSEKPSAPSGGNPLAVPYFSQLDNASGTGYRECFSSSCAMIAAYWGLVGSDDEYNKIRSRFGDTTDPQAQLSALRSLGLVANFYTDGTPGDLRAEVEKGRPAAVGWLHKGSVQQPSGGGHYSVIIGVTEDVWIHHDPNGECDLVRGTYPTYATGKSVRYSFRNWEPRWLVDGAKTGWWLQAYKKG